MFTPFLFLLCSLACFRLTRLITDDKITDWLRSFVIKEAPAKLKQKAKEGIRCPFCVSFYFAVILSVAICFMGILGWIMLILWIPAVWGASVLLNQIFVTLSK